MFNVPSRAAAFKIGVPSLQRLELIKVFFFRMFQAVRLGFTDRFLPGAVTKQRERERLPFPWFFLTQKVPSLLRDFQVF